VPDHSDSRAVVQPFRAALEDIVQPFSAETRRPPTRTPGHDRITRDPDQGQARGVKAAIRLGDERDSTVASNRRIGIER
jgi:hypothetical protein